MITINALLPPYELMRKYCNSNDVNMRSYYGFSPQDKLRTWAFRRRIYLVLKLLFKDGKKVKIVLDAGSGALFASYPLVKKFRCKYVGIDIMPLLGIQKYRKVMELVMGQKIDVIRASITSLPFKRNSFDASLSLDVLEHLEKLEDALKEISRVTVDRIKVSLPWRTSYKN
jgi:SAM-dependent methyltransferase